MALERENVKPVLAVILAALFAQAQAPKKMAGRIRIETAPSGAIRFTPAEIVAWAGDTIHWFNDTDEAHEPGVIRKDGHVDGITLLLHLDNRLDASAQEALAKWQFEPALRNGSAVEVDAIFEIPFHLAPRPK